MKKIRQLPPAIGAHMKAQQKEAYNQLRASIIQELAQGTQAGCVLGITSALRKEGKSLSAVNLAYSLMGMDKKVLVLDCDFHNSSMASLMAFKPEYTLHDILTGECSTAEATYPYTASRLQVIPACTSKPASSALLGSAQMKTLLDDLKSQYDYVVLDLPAFQVTADALLLSHWIDGLLLVVREKFSKKKALLSMVRQLETATVKVLGFLYRAAP